MKKQFVNLKNARTPDQLALMEKINKDGVCPFCPDFLESYHGGKIINESEFWVVTDNMSPYPNSTYHFLIILKRCEDERRNLTSDERIELLKICDLLEWSFQMPGSTLLLRSGDWDYTGSSVSHLHAHLIMGSGDPEKKVRARVG